jgi:DNA polymerase-3 subunit epsilon
MDTLIAIVVFGLAGAFWMKRKGRSPIVGFALGGILNVFGLIIIYFLKSNQTGVTTQREVQNPSAKPSFSGSRFAQDGGKGALFSYPSTSSGRELPLEFAVIDLETSGLEPSNSRIIEIAILLMNSKGEVQEEYATLVNPGNGQVGPTFIHHITEEAVSTAPTFEEIAGDILSRLENRIVVAHHAAFEDKFLASEFRRAGVKLPALPTIDTLLLVRQIIDLPNYKMDTVLQHFGIDGLDLHTALGDVRALAKILPEMLKQSPPILFAVAHSEFPTIQPSGRQKTRVTNLKKGEKGWMSSLLEKLPESGSEASNEVESDYLNLLGQVLADGKIIGDEVKALSKLAGEAGLGSKQLKQLHESFLNQIKAQAASDGNVDAEELKKIEQIINQLSLN